MLMSERWRNSAKTALGVGGCGDQLPRASRCGKSMLRRWRRVPVRTCVAVVDGHIAVTHRFQAALL